MLSKKTTIFATLGTFTIIILLGVAVGLVIEFYPQSDVEVIKCFVVILSNKCVLWNYKIIYINQIYMIVWKKIVI